MATSLVLFELRWICGVKEGVCWIRDLTADGASAELANNAGFYGAPHEHPLIVMCVPTDRIVKRLRGGRVR